MTIAAMVLMVLGTGFLLVAAIGVIRLHDPLQRMHSATKAGTLGTSLVMIGVMLSGVVQVGGTALLAIMFLLLTLPIGAQLLGRASYLSGISLQGLDHDPLQDELKRAERSLGD